MGEMTGERRERTVDWGNHISAVVGLEQFLKDIWHLGGEVEGDRKE